MYNLDDLLSTLEGKTGIEKSASATEPVKASLETILEKKASVDLVTAAQSQGEALARELLTKFANEIQIENAATQASQEAAVTPTSEGTVGDNVDETLSKAIASGATTEDRADQLLDGGTPQGDGAAVQSQPATKEDDMSKLAQAIFEKLAAETEVATNPIVNKLQEDAAVQDSQAAAKVQPTPEGTVNEILQQIVAGAQASGAGSEDYVTGNGGPAEGAASTQPVGQEGGEGATESDEQEKVAAVNALVGAGFDFDSAVSLVKQAEAELAADALEMDKVAAMDQLLAAGVDFDSAADMVKKAAEEIAKEAGMADTAAKAFKAAKVDAKVAGSNLKEAVMGTGKPGGRLSAAKNFVTGTTTGKLATGAAALGAAALGAKALTEKKAEAMGELLAAGVDFDSAASMVKKACEELGLTA